MYEEERERQHALIEQMHLYNQQAALNKYPPGGLGSAAGVAGGIMGNHAPAYGSLDVEHRIRGELDHLTRRVEGLMATMNHLEGFYTWMVHTYPDKIAEFKAIQDVMESIKARDEG